MMRELAVLHSGAFGVHRADSLISVTRCGDKIHYAYRTGDQWMPVRFGVTDEAYWVTGLGWLQPRLFGTRV